MTAVPRDLTLLGILLIALRGLRTLTVLMAERFNFSTSKQYSRALEKYSGQFSISRSESSFIFMFKTLPLLKISDERKPKIKGQNENHRTSHSTIHPEIFSWRGHSIILNLNWMSSIWFNDASFLECILSLDSPTDSIRDNIQPSSWPENLASFHAKSCKNDVKPRK